MLAIIPSAEDTPALVKELSTLLGVCLEDCSPMPWVLDTCNHDLVEIKDCRGGTVLAQSFRDPYFAGLPAETRERIICQTQTNARMFVALTEVITDARMKSGFGGTRTAFPLCHGR